MDKQAALKMIEELLEMDQGSLNGDELLASLGNWDSLAVIGLIALADERCGKSISPSAIADAQTINNIVSLLV